MANSRIDLSRFLQMRLNVYLAYLLPRRIYQTYLYLLGVYYYLIRPKEFKGSSDIARLFCLQIIAKLKNGLM